ncbi:SusC/RagA family TonB-linked outer membrane protein [Parapedobacter pyrenivorans]|uniref:SusC/RagA family TonB-linked outer membrane protein n=1 Tax=Parapedobacter pyrenivorans TaxID=1305674 RepID=A0A917I182_9SPHI|nr:TonB-dependent receptor [Parapedobacter pyrenivorans]GGH03263.1 SusC/RagA family TonB-linked outer membrane protein [Parapedobacter pyrenivorans]
MRKAHYFLLLANLTAYSALALDDPIRTSRADNQVVKIENGSQQTVSGTVRDDTGTALEGVSVTVKRTGSGVATDAAGKFALEGVEPTDALVFRSIGYQDLEVEVAGKTTVDAVMEADVAGLDEVVVVGYGTQRKSSVTAAISKVENKNLDQIPVGRPELALVGRLAGVNISNTRSNPGSAPTIRVRGSGSISASNDPLVVIDGFPGGSMSSVNMNDVASIEVLKDASSAAIYGSRGSGGVIIITTKKGTVGKPQLQLNAYAGVAEALGHDDWISGDEFHDYVARYMNREYAWQGGDVSIPLWGDDRRPPNFRVNPVIREGNYIWEDILLRPAPMQNYSLSVRGGTDNVTYYVSGTYRDEQGTLLTTGYKTYAFRANVDAKLAPGINVGIMVSPNWADRRTSPVTMEAIVKTSPFVSPEPYPDGTYPRPLDYWGNSVSGQTSPLATLYGTFNTSSSMNNVGEMYAEAQLGKGLSIRSSFGANITYGIAENFQSASATSNGLNSGSARDTRSLNLLNENVLRYTNDFGGDHDFNAILGASFQKATSRTALQTAVAGSFNNETIRTLNNAIIDPSRSYTTKSRWGLISYFGRVNYAYKGKYLVSASFRTDGSSRFGPDNRWGNFPSASIAWRVSQEDFMQGNTVISELKPRVSYGVVGNFNIGDFSYLGTIDDVYYSPDDALTKGWAQNAIGNGGLQWERTESYNIGLDLGLFNNRLTMAADYYQKKTTNLLYDVSVPAISGFPAALVNVGDVRNTGFEVELNSQNLTGVFKWSTAFNFSRNKNEVVDLGGVDEVINTHTRGMAWILRKGEPMFSFYGYKLAGVLVDENDVANSPIMDGSKPGNTKYADVSGPDGVPDGKITPDDRVILGSYLPTMTFGMVNDFSWKNFDLSIAMQSSVGAKVYNLENLYYQGATVSAIRRSLVENQWWSTAEPGNGKEPATALSQLAWVSNSDYYLEDASFLAIRNLNLGYTVPQSFSERYKINSFRLFASISNLLMITKKGFHGYNPEGFTSGEIDGIKSMPGFNNGSEPINRVYTFGVNVIF